MFRQLKTGEVYYEGNVVSVVEARANLQAELEKISKIFPVKCQNVEVPLGVSGDNRYAKRHHFTIDLGHSVNSKLPENKDLIVDMLKNLVILFREYYAIDVLGRNGRDTGEEAYLINGRITSKLQINGLVQAVGRNYNGLSSVNAHFLSDGYSIIAYKNRRNHNLISIPKIRTPRYIDIMIDHNLFNTEISAAKNRLIYTLIDQPQNCFLYSISITGYCGVEYVQASN